MEADLKPTGDKQSPPELPHRGLFRVIALGLAAASALLAIANLRGLWLTALIVVGLLLESRIHALWRSSRPRPPPQTARCP